MNEIRVSIWNVLRPVLVTGMVVLSALACDTGSGGGSSKKNPEPALTVTVTEVSKKAATDVRDSYGLFSITADKDVENFYLAVKETGEAAPTAAEMTAHGLKRKLSTTAITVLIAQRMNAPMITFAKTFFDDPTKQTLGTGMHGDDLGKNWNTGAITGVVSDGADAAGAWTKATQPWVEESILRPETDYTLYGMSDDTVQNLLEFSTDASSPTSWTTTETDMESIDTTVAEDHGLTMTLNSDEYYIIPIQMKSPDSITVKFFQIHFSQQHSIDVVIHASANDLNIYGAPDAGYTYQLAMYPHRDTIQDTMHSAFLLIDTSRIVTNGNSDLDWGMRFNYADTSESSYHKLKFTIQE